VLIRKYPQAAKERELALYQKALIHGQQNDNVGMAESFETLLKDYPKSPVAPEAHFWIGSTAFDAKDYAKAAVELDRARTLDSDQYFERATLRIILSYFYQDDKANVAKEVDRYNKSGKSKPPVEVLRWLCDQLTTSHEYESAETYLSQLNARDEVQPKDMLELGKTRLELKKYSEAGEALKRYLGTVHEPPTRALGLLELSKAQKGQKDYEAAQKSVDEALNLQPEGKISGEARIVAGQIQEARGNFEEAAKLYMSVAVILDDEEVTPRALDQAVKAYQKAGKDAEAKKTLNLLQSRYPEYFQRQKQPK
jgi:TolA-binding protein